MASELGYPKVESEWYEMESY